MGYSTSPKVSGLCQACRSPTTAKCGKYIVWHWAHKPEALCDHWWETETEWHRGWKNRFPTDWQEIVLISLSTHEKHIADIRTSSGLLLEMQRSNIDSSEVLARESFYQKMVWIVDGCKNDADRYHFSLMRERPDKDGLAAFR
jgi:competence CoiA-like predicted nuclease